MRWWKIGSIKRRSRSVGLRRRRSRDRADAGRCVRHVHATMRRQNPNANATSIADHRRCSSEIGRFSICEAASGCSRKTRSADCLRFLIKEFVHLRRQPSTLFFLLVIPVIQTLIFGYALETQIDNIPMAVFNMDGQPASRELVDSFANTRKFKVSMNVFDDESFRRALTSGQAKAGLRDSAGLFGEAAAIAAGAGAGADRRQRFAGRQRRAVRGEPARPANLDPHRSNRRRIAPGRAVPRSGWPARAADRCPAATALQPRPGERQLLRARAWSGSSCNW